MKRVLFAFLLLPQLVYSQYRANCFSLNQTEGISQVKIGYTFIRDTTLALNEIAIISGLSITGHTVLYNDNDSYIRVTLVDDNNYEFLVYENYPMLSDELTTFFSNITLETVSLDNITPKYLKISILNSSLTLESLNYTNASLIKKKYTKDLVDIKKAQTQYIVDKLNANLKRHNMTWRAGITSMSNKSYSEKKGMFSGKVPELYGFEHYVGGIFVLPTNEEQTCRTKRDGKSNQYVTEWDWRNRHGQNWMTPVQLQIDSTCWAFSAVGALEAYINLYYNRHLDYDLSEQELRSCSITSNDGSGNYFNGLEYVRRNGLVLENCFPYVGHYVDCSNKCASPTEIIHIQSRKRITYDENTIKEKLFIAPVLFTIVPWAHQVVIAGYKTVKNGDVIYNGNSNSMVPITIDSITHANLIDKTAWLIKNSWGTTWGDSGYGYVVATPAEHSCYISGKITSMVYSDADIICEDADGDGYYFWGIGDKPSYCPSWVPDSPDGNDANASEGALNEYGILERLNPDTIPPLIINSDVEYVTRQSLYTHIRITQNGTLRVKNTLNLFGHATITIDNGGKLIIDGGTITNAYIVMNAGSQLKFINDGLLVCRSNTNFYAPSGALVEMNHGKICNSLDF